MAHMACHRLFLQFEKKIKTLDQNRLKYRMRFMIMALQEEEFSMLIF